MKPAKLHLIKGGKTKAGGSGKGGGPPPPTATRRGGGRRRRPNPLNQLLWYVTSRAKYPQRAISVEDIATRMTRQSQRIMGRHINVSNTNAATVIDDGRRRRAFYGWMLLHVEKGAKGDNRGYVPVLADVDDQDTEVFLIDDDDLRFTVSGLVSSVGTVESMIANDADGLSFLIGCLEALDMKSDADRFREFAAECRAFSRRAAEVKRHAETL